MERLIKKGEIYSNGSSLFEVLMVATDEQERLCVVLKPLNRKPVTYYSGDLEIVPEARVVGYDDLYYCFKLCEKENLDEGSTIS